MRNVKRWLTPAVVVVVLLISLAAPAMGGVDCDDPKFADKPQCAGGEDPPPDDGPVLVDVTMTLVNGEGLTSNCDDGDGIAGSIEMIRNRDSLDPTHDPVLGVWMNEVEWRRIFDDPWYPGDIGSFDNDGDGVDEQYYMGTGFAGCHRMLVDPEEPEAILGGLSIVLDSSGAVADILWHFDYWYVWGERGSKKKPVRYVADFEQFTLSLDESTLIWEEGTPDVDGDTNGTLTGDFYMLYHHTGEDYQPLPGSPRTMSFTVVAEPRE
jgi:hypothetical protein